MNKLQHFLIGGAVILGVATFAGFKLLEHKGLDTGAPLLPSTAKGGQITLVDETLATDKLPAGWVHRTFWRITPTDYSMVEVDGRSALHCTTDNSGSILMRDTAIPLADFPTLSWAWKIDKPLVSDIDEETRKGDDHPARFFVVFEGSDESFTAVELIWSNRRFAPGDYKIIGGFHHLVVNGLDENIGIWHEQTVDLEALYLDLSGQTDNAEIAVLGFFCDSDNTGGATSAYFSDVRLETR